MEVIHLDSYETTDRGEAPRRAGGAGGGGAGAAPPPRMLFDPKSGKMVAMVPKEEHGAAGRDGRKGKKGGKKEKERKKKGGGGGGGAGRDDPAEPLQLRRQKAADEDDGRRGAGGGRRDRTAKRQGGGAVDPSLAGHEASSNSRAAARSDPSSSSKSRRDQPVSGRGGRTKLPRTCGVLYKEDDRGRYTCADGCEPDQGYGSHSVPGGKVRNPEAHAAYVREVKRQQGDKTPVKADARNGPVSNGGASPVNGRVLDETYGDFSGYEYGGYDYGEMVHNEVAPEIALVKADEKLELITGTDESPTLKPTAREWAPYHTAMSASATMSTPTRTSKTNVDNADDVVAAAAGLTIDDDEENGKNNDDDDEIHAIGLGFDPTLNMDSVMGSPVHGSKRAVEAEPFELAQMHALNAEDIVEDDDGGSPRMPFSRKGKKLDGSRLLGTAGWSIPPAKDSGAVGAFDTSPFGGWAAGEVSRSSSNEQPATFLSFGGKDNNTWGGSFGALSGLGAPLGSESHRKDDANDG